MAHRCVKDGKFHYDSRNYASDFLKDGAFSSLRKQPYVVANLKPKQDSIFTNTSTASSTSNLLQLTYFDWSTMPEGIGISPTAWAFPLSQHPVYNNAR
jgi:hypothetical protein